MSLSTTYTKVETDFLLQQIDKKVVGGYKGDLRISDTAPTEIGYYMLLDVGTYANLGNINAEAGKLNFASFDGTTWSKVEVEMPTPIENYYTNNNTYNLDAEQIVPSEALYNDETLAGDVLKRVDKNTGDNVNYRMTTKFADGSNMTDSKVDNVMFVKIGVHYFKRNFENGIDVKWFGAVGDGIADDTQAFQKAVDFLKSISGGVLIVPQGKYRISHVDFLGKEYSNISIYGNNATILPIYTERKNLDGYPRATFARNNSADGCFFFNCQSSNDLTNENAIKNINIDGLTFISDVENLEFDELSHHISAFGIDNFNVTNCKFVGFLGDGIAINRGDGQYGSSYNANFFCSNCLFDGVNKDNRQGISIYHCDNFKISQCIFKNITRSDMPGAIDIEADSPAVISKNGIIEMCSFENIGGLSAVFFIVTALNSGHISFGNWIVRNCSFKNCNSPFGTFGTDDYLTFQPREMISFENNTIENCDMLGFIRKTNGVRIANNWYKNITTGEMVYDGINRLKLENNHFESIGGTDGIIFRSNCRKIDIVGNNFVGFENKPRFTMNDFKGISKINDNDFGTLTTENLFIIGGNFEAKDVPYYEFKRNNVGRASLIYKFMIQNIPNSNNVLPKHIIDGVSYFTYLIFLENPYDVEIFSEKKGDLVKQQAVSGERIFTRFADYNGDWSVWVDLVNGDNSNIRKIGTTAQRHPANLVVSGTSYYDTTLKKILYADNTENKWRDATGNEVQ